jgi:general secretion pathway protein J
MTETGIRPAHRARGAPREAGFTLLELLIAMTLFGLLMTMLFGGLRFGARAWEAGEERADALAQTGVVHGFLRRQLSQTYPLVWPEEAENPQRVIAFVGGPDTLQFIAPLPAHLAVGGFYLLALDVADDADGRHLVLTWQLHRAGMERFAFDGTAQQTVLLDGVADVAFAYYGVAEEGQDPRWQERWEEAARLPALVSVRVAFEDEGRSWPELVVRPRIDMDAECAFVAALQACRNR